MLVKDATEKALQFIQDVFGVMPEAQEMRLEEIERSADEQYWLITIGYNITTISKNPLFKIPMLQREYKVVQVDRSTGEVVSTKIREPLEYIA